MKTKFNKYILVAMLFGLTFSCSDDFLDVKPIAADNEASFYITMSDADLATTAVYAQLAYMTVWDRQMQMIMGSIASDDAEAGGEDYGDVITWQDLNKFKHLPTSDIFVAAFGGPFKAVFLANKAIERLPDVLTADPKADAKILNNRIAELKFLRALHYFALTYMFGEVPLVDHVLGASEFEQPRAPLRKIYDFMEQDLKDAIAVLPVSYNGEVGRATKGAAQAILAKLYLYESSYAKNYPGDARFADLKERWSDALATAEDVINSGNYELLGANGEKFSSWRGSSVSGFRYLFTVSADNSKESIFEVENIQDGQAWLKSRGSTVSHWSGARYYYDAANKKQSTGYWGFNVPSKDLMNEFEAGDPRLDVTVHRTGGDDSIEMSAGWFKICFDNTVTGLYQNKFDCSYAEYKKNTSSWAESPYNTKIIRFADVVLIAAEAAVMAGDNAKALKYVNMVRTRARNSGTTGKPEDLGGTVTLDQIKHERRVELALEGFRYYDLVRWGDAFKELDGFVLEDGTVLEFLKGKNEFFPIPQKEIDISRGKMKQYPGW